MEANNQNNSLPGLFSRLAIDVDSFEEAEEVDEVASAPPSGLLSLTGKAEELLLSHLTRGKGGTQRLLNLRLTCSTTKGWVDDLLLQQGRRLFANCQARVDLRQEGSLERFVENPPPSHVTSLFLEGADGRFDPNMESWNSFVQWWSPRLNSLEMKKLSLPPNIRLNELVASTSIRRFCCEEISLSGPADIPRFLFQLEELRLDLGRNWTEDPRRRAILRILGSAGKLLIPKWTIQETRSLQFATDLLRMRKHDVSSQVTFHFETSSFSHEADEESIQNFVTAIAASPFSCSIRVKDIRENFLQLVAVLNEEEIALKFFRCVESIDRFSGISVELLPLTKFLHLEKLDCLQGDIRGPIEFPRSLQFLSVLEGLPSEAILSPFLTSMDLRHVECSAVDLVRSLNLINEICGRLENLRLHWFYLSRGEKEEEEQLGALQEDQLFPNLRWLSLRVKSRFDAVEDVQLVLSNGIGLSRLSLTSLFVGWWSRNEDAAPAPLFDAALLRSLIEGPLGKSLCDVEIDKRWVAEGAEELVEALERKAEENSEKRKLEAL